MHKPLRGRQSNTRTASRNESVLCGKSFSGGSHNIFLLWCLSEIVSCVDPFCSVFLQRCDRVIRIPVEELVTRLGSEFLQELPSFRRCCRNPSRLAIALNVRKFA
jgi:hypothetical protein